MRKFLILFVLIFSLTSVIRVQGQLTSKKTGYTLDDSLRGSLNPYRTWWNVQQYALHVTPDLAAKTISGKNTISFSVSPAQIKALGKNLKMQIDLQSPMKLVLVMYKNAPLRFDSVSKNTYYLYFKEGEKFAALNTVELTFGGKPRAAVNPPWDGGWIWQKDNRKRPFVSVACQGLGASVWYPCKDHQSDEPEKGASLSISIPDTLMAVSNGRLVSTLKSGKTATYTWQVNSPINSYTLVPYIGKYVSFSDTFSGINGTLSLDYYVLDYNLTKAKSQFTQVKNMLRCFEYWFGPYPFYNDGYKLVEAPHLGMEHQSAIAYGNRYVNGYLGTDLSGTGRGKSWDYIIVHESGHEWFANSITTNDIADMWVHEGFTTYSETLFVECEQGKKAGEEYNFGQRKNIENDRPVIGPYGVNEEGSGDMYFKGAAMLQTLRNSLNDDVLWRKMLTGLNKTFYQRTVTTQEIESFVSQQCKFEFSKVFDQYLRTTKVPVLKIKVTDAAGGKIAVHYENIVPGFNLPIWLESEGEKARIYPTAHETIYTLKPVLLKALNQKDIEFKYYLKVIVE